MPELPEVETIGNRLRSGTEDHPSLLEREITDVSLYWERTLAMPSADEFKQKVCGQLIKDIWRRGKYLVFTLSVDSLLVHLRMSGDLWVEQTSLPIAPHHRLVLELGPNLRLAFNDTRKFGRVWFTPDPALILNNLGPEPLSDILTAADFHQRLLSYRRQLKPLLLDQHFLAGMGNIYTDEALHLSRLHPLTPSNTLTFERAEQLLMNIRQVLSDGIRRNGTSIDWVYRGGDYQNQLRVYHRTGEPCSRCGTQIERILVGGRSTHICPKCQSRSAYQD
jgi:formamidopyrimidine-DNA glycosylase